MRLAIEGWRLLKASSAGKKGKAGSKSLLELQLMKTTMERLNA